MQAEGEHAAAVDLSRWYGTSMVGVPAPVLASVSFNQAPQPLHVAGVHAAHAPLFNALQNTEGAGEADVIAQTYDATLPDKGKLHARTVDWSTDKK